MRMMLACFALAYGLVAFAGDIGTLRNELESMFEADQSLRREIREVEERDGPDSGAAEAMWVKQAVLDETNTKRLLEIVDEHGWPRASVVGDRAAMAAFLVVQHAEPTLQKRMLPILREEASRGEVKMSRLALLEDRVLTSEGKPQIYGSQLRDNPETGKLEFFPIKDPESVNARRASVGLEPIEVYARRFGLEYNPANDG